LINAAPAEMDHGTSPDARSGVIGKHSNPRATLRRDRIIFSVGLFTAEIAALDVGDLLCSDGTGVAWEHRTRALGPAGATTRRRRAGRPAVHRSPCSSPTAHWPHFVCSIKRRRHHQ
jgi:hypothetical protein